MHWGWVAVLDIGVGLVLLACLVIVSFAVRRRLLARAGATFDCALRIVKNQSWALGWARYLGDDLQWFRVFSWSSRPRAAVNRRGLTEVTHGGVPNGAPTYVGQVLVEVVTSDGDRIEFAMSADALTGFLAWLEAAPPGADAYADTV